jgi:hypothetical protein
VADGLQAARTELDGAELASHPNQRYAAAYRATLKVAAEIIGVCRPQLDSTRPRNVWDLVSQLAPELAEWAGFFAAVQDRAHAVAADQRPIVSEREADDLLRDASAFTDQVARWRTRRQRAVEAQTG